MTGSPDVATIAAFIAVAVIGGSNAVAIRLGNVELAPFWGAALRFLAAGLVLLAIVALLRKPLPRGRALTGTLLFGLLNFGLSYAFLYWALQEATAATAQIVLALAPLATFILAVAQRVERFRLLGLIGALVAGAGVLWLFLGSAEGVSVWSLLALLGATLSIAQAGIVIKRFPRVHPVPANAVAMAFGGLILLAISVAAGEAKTLPTEAATWISLVYLIILGSICLFLLVLYVLHRWTASASSFALLLSPVMTVILGAWVLDEPVTPGLLWGGLLVVAGVYVGVFFKGANAAR